MWQQTNCVLNTLVRMARSEQMIISLAVANNKLVNDVLDLGAIRANDTDKNHAVSNELLDQVIETRRVPISAVQQDFLWVWHGEV